MHDGGINVVMKVNGKLFCDSKANYGGTKATMETGDGQKWETIQSMIECEGPLKVVRGDIITVEANYDLDMHPASVPPSPLPLSNLLCLVFRFD